MKGRAWVLVASLALNLFLGGVLAGNWIADRRDPPPLPPPAEGGPVLFGHLQHMMRGLPPPERAEIRQAVARYRTEIRERQAALREARRQVSEVMAAETFDPAAAAQAFASLRERTVAAQASIHQVLVEAAARLPPEDRRRLVEAAAGGRGPPAFRGPRGGGPPPFREPPPGRPEE